MKPDKITKNPIVNNSGIISTGDNANNTVYQSNSLYPDIDWSKLEKELEMLKASSNFMSIKTFTDDASNLVKKRNFSGLVSRAKKLGEIGFEIISKTSATVLTEIIKKALNL